MGKRATKPELALLSAVRKKRGEVREIVALLRAGAAGPDERRELWARMDAIGADIYARVADFLAEESRMKAGS